MQKKGELSRLAVNLLIGSLIIILGVIIWIILRGGTSENQQVFTDENIDLKISQVKKVNDNTLDLTLKRDLGEGEFVGLSFAVSDGSLTEVVRVNTSMPENQTGNFSLNFVSLNASKVQSISVTPIYINEEGSEVIGNVKDEYVTPNTCSNYCPPKAQCGLNDCGMQCGSGCGSGYLCLNYKCIKQKTSSGGGGGGGGSTPSCTDTCSSLKYGCGVHNICGKNVNCGTCQTGYTCSTNSTCIKNPINCTDTCSTFGYNCGIQNICNISTNCGNCSTGFICNLNGLCECNSTCSSLGYQCGTRTVCGNSVNCGTCSTGYTCQTNGTCMRDCVPTTCSILGRNCGTVSDGCSGTLNCGSCSIGYTCQTNGTCTQNPCTDTCSSLVKQCGTHTICGISTNCGTCSTGYTCSSGLCIPSCVPTTCAALARNCGTVSDGCGGTLTCGNYGGGCQTGYTCSSGLCIPSCTPTTCAALARNCGTVSDGCGGTLTCGSYGGGCQSGYTCSSGLCIPSCVPNCAGKNCGVDGCGGSCGTCSTGYTCQVGNGTCMRDCVPTTCSILGRNCGTVSDGCSGTLNCGTCSTGYTCQINGTCIKDIVVSCNGVTCKSGEYCSNGACLLNVTGKTYFVATNGNDAWSGNFTHPWATWQKAFTSTSVNAGDLVYFRGGVYQTTVKTGLGIEATRSGTVNNWIVYMNYPGETPILDCGNIVQGDIQYTGLRNVGIEFSNIYYVKLVGLTVRNVKQYYDRNFGVGIRVSGGNMILERCTAYNIWGHGFETWFGDKAGDKVYFINCDAYNCNDLISGNPAGSNAGNTGAGFSLWDSSSNALGEVHLYNCRAWNASDQGFQTGASHYVEAVGCWSFGNKAYVMGGGTGWKMGWMDYEAQPKEMYNNLVACNDGSGFLTNEWYGVDIPITELYNNLVYKNGLKNGFGLEISSLESGPSNDELLRVFKNNLVYGNINGDVFTYANSQYTHDHNSWDSSVSVNDNDFVSLNCSQLYAPRKSDGSLPDVTFGHLAAGSDLIDKGVIISGYHCSTAGAHPGENCREWYGAAPDLGAFESNYVSSCNGVTCKSGEYCSNGVCLMNVTGKTYFVATNGNDAWTGNFTHPWKTWKKAFTSTSVNAGDIVYFRGGVYHVNGTSPQISASRTGTSTNWIIYSNYPGETPILDFTYADWGTAESRNGLWFYTESCNYIKLIGLNVRNILQNTNAYEQLTFGIVFNNGFFKAERCTVYNVNGIGFYSYFYNGWPSVNGEHYFINCDAYNCSNPYAVPPALPGNYGVGFSAQNFAGTEGRSYAINCRAWNNGDQGFSWNGDQYCEIENCWAMDNGQLQGEGHGFKMGWNDRDYPNNALRHKYTNCIAAHNLASGFNTNEGDSVASRKYIYNSLAYGNGFDLPYGGFWISNTGDTNEKELLRIFINNLAYSNINENLWVPISGALFTSNHNSWDVSGITINNNDFVSLNYSQLYNPRKADGSLPDITFGHLAQGSDLIDKGVVISGYHCSTSGAHPGEDCVEWYGAAPDLGAFESNY